MNEWKWDWNMSLHFLLIITITDYCRSFWKFLTFKHQQRFLLKNHFSVLMSLNSVFLCPTSRSSGWHHDCFHGSGSVSISCEEQFGPQDAAMMPSGATISAERHMTDCKLLHILMLTANWGFLWSNLHQLPWSSSSNWVCRVLDSHVSVPQIGLQRLNQTGPLVHKLLKRPDYLSHFSVLDLWLTNWLFRSKLNI